MSISTIPATTAPGSVAPAGAFYALTTSVDVGLLSKRVNEVRVEVLAGSVAQGDTVELVRVDGSGMEVLVRGLRANPFVPTRASLLLKDPRPLRTEVGELDVARTPGLAAPQLSLADEASGAHLSAAVRAARLTGFAAESRVRPPVLAFFLEATAMRERFRRLPDAAVVLLVLKRIRSALAPHAKSDELLMAFGAAADCLEAIGLLEDADRYLLAASGALRAAAEGAQPGSVPSAVGSLLGGGAAWDVGARWAARSDMLGEVRKIEAPLLRSGRAVAIGWCKRCRAPVTLDAKQRCTSDGRKPDEIAVVVPSDIDITKEDLRRRHG